MTSVPPDADIGLPRRGARVLLRRLTPADLDSFAAWRADPELARYQGWQPMSRDAALAFLQQMQLAPAFVVGQWFQLGIADAGHAALFGDLGICLHPDGGAEMGITLRREAQGRGLGTEALRLLAQMLFEWPSVQRVLGITDARNLASARLLERAGLRHARTDETVFRGEPCTEWVFERPRAPLTVRPAVPGDAASLAALAVRTFETTYGALNRPEDTRAFLRDHYGPVQLAREIADASITTLLAACGDTLLGFAQVAASAAPTAVTVQPALTLSRLYVDARWHGQGLGPKLLAAAASAAQACGAQALWLSVWERNPRAVAFYLRQGFIDVGATVFMVGDDAQRDRVMLLDLR